VVPVAEPSGLDAEEGGPRRNFGRFRQVCQLGPSSDLPEEDSAQLAQIRQRSEINSQSDAHTLFNGKPAPAIVVSSVIYALNNYESLKAAGFGFRHLPR
jgi:hypothetical protein